MMAMNSGAALGVVIIGRNEGQKLVACLRSVAGLNLPIVYVDSASTDGSCDVARSFRASVVELDMSRPFTAARARNEGAAMLVRQIPRLRYIQFVDGDCELIDGWIDRALAVLEERADVVAVCGQRAERFPERSFYNRLCDDEWNTPVGDTLACGGDAMMRIAAFVDVQGFDPSMVAHEEPELCARLRARGGIIARIDVPMTLHDANILRFSQWWRRNVRAGFGYTQALMRAPGYRSDEAALLRRALTWSLLPLLAVAALAAGRPIVALGVVLLYPLQILRLVWRSSGRLGWTAAVKTAGLNLIGKFAETLGVVRFCIDTVLRRRRGAILYR